MILYFSKSNKTKNIVQKADVMSASIWEESPQEPYVLVTPTYGKGEVPSEVRAFLQRNGSHNLMGVIGVGNRVFGNNFANAGKRISYDFGVPLLGSIEYPGTQQDIQLIERAVRERCQPVKATNETILSSTMN